MFFRNVRVLPTSPHGLTRATSNLIADYFPFKLLKIVNIETYNKNCKSKAGPLQARVALGRRGGIAPTHSCLRH
jgi:hypothetical protein